MRLAVLSDIHGNLPALKRCFELIDKTKVDGLVFVGDYISDIPYSKEVLKFIKFKSKQYKTWIVSGNREEYILGYHVSPTKNWTLASNKAAVLVAYNSLDEDDINYLRMMKKYEVIDIPGTDKIYVTHKFRDIKYNDDFEYRYVIFGHEHNQLYFSQKGIRFFNPGSVGLPADGFWGASLLFLDYKNKQWNPYFCHLEYNVSEAIDKIDCSLINHENVRWGNMLIKTLKTGDNYTGMYVDEVKRLAKMRGLSTILEEMPSDIWSEARINLGLDEIEDL